MERKFARAGGTGHTARGQGWTLGNWDIGKRAHIPNFSPLLGIPGPAAKPPTQWVFLGCQQEPSPVAHGKRKEENCWAQHKSMGKPLTSFPCRICSYRNNGTQASTRKNLSSLMLSILTSIPMCSIKTVHSKLQIFRWQKGSWLNQQCQGHLRSLDYCTNPGFPRRLHGILISFWREKNTLLFQLLHLNTIFVWISEGHLKGSLPPRHETWCFTAASPVSHKDSTSLSNPAAPNSLVR